MKHKYSKYIDLENRECVVLPEGKLRTELISIKRLICKELDLDLNFMFSPKHPLITGIVKRLDRENKKYLYTVGIYSHPYRLVWVCSKYFAKKKIEILLHELAHAYVHQKLKLSYKPEEHGKEFNEANEMMLNLVGGKGIEGVR